MFAASCQVSVSCTLSEPEGSERRRDLSLCLSFSPGTSELVITEHFLRAVPFLQSRSQATHCYLREGYQMASAAVLLVCANLRKRPFRCKSAFTCLVGSDLHIFCQTIIYSDFVVAALNARHLGENSPRLFTTSLWSQLEP